MWNADRNNFQPRFGATYKLNETTRPARRRRPVHRAVPVAGRPRHQHRHQSARVHAQHAGAGDERQRPHVPGEPDQPGAERRAARAGGLRRSGCARISATRRATSFRPIASTRTTGATASASRGSFRRGFLVELSYIGQRGTNVPILEVLNYVPQQFRSSSPIRDANAGDVPQPGGRQSAPGPDARRAGQQRRDHRAPPAAVAVPAVRRQRRLRRRRRSAWKRRTASNIYHGMIARVDKRFTQGFMLMSSYTWSRLRENVTPLNPWEEPGDARRRVGSTASHHAGERPRAALRARPSLRQQLERRRGFDPGRLAVEREVRMADRTAAGRSTATPTTTPACGDPRDLKSSVGHGLERRGARRRRADSRHGVLLLAQQPAVPQRGRPAVDVHRHGDSARAGEHPHLPDDARRTSGS